MTISQDLLQDRQVALSVDEQLKSSLLSVLSKLESAPAPTKWDKILAFLNAPFAITMAGGVLLAIVSAMITNGSAKNAKDRDIALEKLRQKQAFVQSFQSDIERYLALTVLFRQRDIFLQRNQGEDARAGARFIDGGTWQETHEKSEEARRFWLEQSHTSPFALINSAMILFANDDPISKALSELSASADAYGAAQTQEELQKSYYQILGQLKGVTSLMAGKVYEN